MISKLMKLVDRWRERYPYRGGFDEARHEVLQCADELEAVLLTEQSGARLCQMCGDRPATRDLWRTDNGAREC